MSVRVRRKPLVHRAGPDGMIARHHVTVLFIPELFSQKIRICARRFYECSGHAEAQELLYLCPVDCSLRTSVVEYQDYITFCRSFILYYYYFYL